MARIEILPYRVMDSDRVRAYWYEGDVGSDRELPTSLPKWDAETPIDVAVAAEVDVAGALTDAGLDSSVVLVAALLWSSPGTRLRALGDRGALSYRDGGTQNVTLSCRIPGEHLADSVDLSLLVALADPHPTAHHLSPRRVGARLWSETRSVALTGAGGRFPMQWEDFGQIALPDHAAWFLDWTPGDLHRRTGNALCLFLNSRHDNLRVAMEAPDPDAKVRLLFDILRYDVGRAILIGALHNEDLLEDRGNFDKGTLGDTVSRLIESLFQDYDLESLAKKAQEDPARFEALVQDRLRLTTAF